MYSNVSAADTNTTFQVKSNELVPSIEPQVESLFHRIIDTGYTVTIKTPVGRNNKSALFGVNLSGFIPDFSYQDPAWTLMQKNMCPVQPFYSSKSYVSVTQDMMILPVMQAMLSNRFCSGTVNVIFRISSNTVQTGNLIITQQSGLTPRLYTLTESYQGARFQNDGHYSSDPMIGNFSIVDTSLIRQVGVRTIFRHPIELVDIQKKLFEFTSTSPSPQAVDQFPEDWLMVGLTSSLPDSTASELYIRVFFDYSEVSFYSDMYPIMPAIPHNPSQQILQYTRTFVDSTTATKANARFLPLDSTTFEDSVQEELSKLMSKQKLDQAHKEAKERLTKINADRLKAIQDAKAQAAKQKEKDTDKDSGRPATNTIHKRT
ncbi:hypothetical protein [Picornaviridae sp.]|nr:hypothetical protein [Picornaviridae sp.]